MHKMAAKIGQENFIVSDRKAREPEIVSNILNFLFVFNNFIFSNCKNNSLSR